MRVAYISAGAAGMICGACLHDNTLAAALQRQGHEVALVPIYTPLRTDEPDVSTGRIFFGAVNVYLQQRRGLFRHTPWVLDRLLDSRGLLGWVSRMDSSLDAAELSALTLSMLRGEEGHQRKELHKLVGWLRDTFRPDVVHLSNSLLLGMAGPIRAALGCPVVCSVQGEELFVHDMAAPDREQVLEQLRRRSQDADAFIAPGRDYAREMAGLLDVPRERMHQVPLGLNLQGHGAPREERGDGPLVIGYMARICPEKGLHLLAEAFREITRRLGTGRVRLEAAGYLGARDRDYARSITEEIGAWGLADSFAYLGEVDREAKLAFLRRADVLSVPATYREPKGLYVLEALANATPVVQPAHGSFPEMLELTGGGVLFEPGSVPALVEALEGLLSDAPGRRELGRRGQEAVRRQFNDDVMASRTAELYRQVRA